MQMGAYESMMPSTKGVHLLKREEELWIHSKAALNTLQRCLNLGILWSFEAPFLHSKGAPFIKGILVFVCNKYK